MYKHKGLKRTYIFTYVMWLFGCLTTPLLFYKLSNVASIITFVLSLIALGGFITAHYLYKNKHDLFEKINLGASALYIILILTGLILEAIYTSQGYKAQYAWFVIIISLIDVALLCYFSYRDYYKYRHIDDYPELKD